MRASLSEAQVLPANGSEQIEPASGVELRSAVADRSRTGRHAFLMVFATILVAVLNYALNIILGWSLPVEQYGRVGVSQTLIFVCIWLISAGFPWVVTRSIAQAHKPDALDDEREEAWRTYKTARVANIALTVVVVGLLEGAFFAGWLPLEPSYAPLVVVVGVTVAALGFGSIPNAGLQGTFRFERIAALRIIEAAANIVISVGLVIAGFGAAGALAGFAVAAVIAAGLAARSMSGTRFTQIKGWGGLDALRTALPMTLAVFGGVLLTNVDLLSVKFLTGPANSDSLSGAYQVGAVLARAPLFIGTALVSTFYPRIAQQAGNLQAARELVRWTVMGLLPINLVLSVGAPAVVLFFFPGRYASSGLLLAVLALGSAFLVVAGALAAVLQARHQVKVPAVVMTGAVVLQVAGLTFAVPAFGAIGAATVSTVAGGLAVLLLAWNCRHLQLAPRDLPRYGAALLLLAVPALLLTLFFSGQSRIFVALWVGGSLLVYVAALFVFNLIQARELAGSVALPVSGYMSAVVQRALALGAFLNRTGEHAGWH